MTHPALDLSAHTGRNYDKGRSRAWQMCWFATQNLIFARWWCPHSLRIWILRLFGAEIGNRVYMRHDVRVHWPWRLSIGDNSWIGEGVWILNLAHVSIGPNVCVSQEVVLLAGGHDRHSPTFEHKNESIHIDDGAWICLRAIVLGGAHIGAHSVIPASTVVRGQVAKSTVVL